MTTQASWTAARPAAVAVGPAGVLYVGFRAASGVLSIFDPYDVGAIQDAFATSTFGQVNGLATTGSVLWIAEAAGVGVVDVTLGGSPSAVPALAPVTIPTAIATDGVTVYVADSTAGAPVDPGGLTPASSRVVSVDAGTASVTRVLASQGFGSGPGGASGLPFAVPRPFEWATGLAAAAGQVVVVDDPDVGAPGIAAARGRAYEVGAFALPELDSLAAPILASPAPGGLADGVELVAGLAAPAGLLSLDGVLFVADERRGFCRAELDTLHGSNLFLVDPALLPPGPASPGAYCFTGAGGGFRFGQPARDQAFASGELQSDTVYLPDQAHDLVYALPYDATQRTFGAGPFPVAPLAVAPGDQPVAVAVDANHRLWIVYAGTNRIDRLDLTVAGSPTTETCARLPAGASAVGLAFAGDSLFVAHSGGVAVLKDVGRAGSTCPGAAASAPDAAGVTAPLGTFVFDFPRAIAGGPSATFGETFLFVADGLGEATTIWRFRLDLSAQLLAPPDACGAAGRAIDLWHRTAYKRAGALAYVPAFSTGLGAQVGQLLVADDPATGGTTPVGRVFETYDVEVPAIAAPVEGTIASPAAGVTLLAQSRAVDPLVAFGEIYDDGFFVASPPYDGLGELTYVDAPLAEGVHHYAVRSSDGDFSAVNLSGPSLPVAVVVDATPPAPPVLPATIGPTNATLLMLTGRTEPGASLVVSPDGATVTAPALDGNGMPVVDWRGEVTFTLDFAGLPDGAHPITVTAADRAGNVSPAAVVSILLDTTPPAEPVITSPADLSGTSAATLAIAVEVPDAGASGGAITVQLVEQDLSSGAQRLVQTLPAAPHVSFAVALPAERDYRFFARALDQAGNSAASAPIVITADRTSPAAPALAVTAPTYAALVPVAGTAEPGVTVTFLVDGAPAATAFPAAADFFTGEFAAHLASVPGGVHQLVAVAIDVGGNASAPSAPVLLVVGSGAPSITTPSSDGTTISSADLDPATGRVAVTGVALPGSTVTVLLDADPTPALAVADAVGSWAVLVPATTEGLHTLTATATDAGGNASPPGFRTFELRTVPADLSAPAAPVLRTPAVGSIVRQTPLEIAGRAEPGSTIRVTVDGVDAGVAVIAGADGSWSLALTPSLGAHTIAVRAIDAAGNVSAEARVAFVVKPPYVPEGGAGCSTGAGGAEASLLGVALLALRRRRRAVGT